MVVDRILVGTLPRKRGGMKMWWLQMTNGKLLGSRGRMSKIFFSGICDAEDGECRRWLCGNSNFDFYLT